jgi:hypothetical protein
MRHWAHVLNDCHLCISRSTWEFGSWCWCWLTNSSHPPNSENGQELCAVVVTLPITSFAVRAAPGCDSILVVMMSGFIPDLPRTHSQRDSPSVAVFWISWSIRDMFQSLALYWQNGTRRVGDRNWRWRAAGMWDDIVTLEGFCLWWYSLSGNGPSVYEEWFKGPRAVGHRGLCKLLLLSNRTNGRQNNETARKASDRSYQQQETLGMIQSSYGQFIYTDVMQFRPLVRESDKDSSSARNDIMEVGFNWIYKVRSDEVNVCSAPHTFPQNCRGRRRRLSAKSDWAMKVDRQSVFTRFLTLQRFPLTETETIFLILHPWNDLWFWLRSGSVDTILRRGDCGTSFWFCYFTIPYF